MKRSLVVQVWTAALFVAMAGLAGCGGSSSSTPVIPVASITSFTAASAAITDGTSTTITGVFTGGSGLITPGNMAATTGTPVTVSPTTTTTYTLTVTPTGGTAVTQTVTITVNPAPPAIASFVASLPTITAGMSSNLTAVFSGGTGVITPGNIPVTSGTAVAVTPAATTIYTVTVTPASGTAITQTVTVTVDAAPTITGFVASSQTITNGQSTMLTGIFSNGTGVITPGNLAATSGNAVLVSPAATTQYTLTVTNGAGTATAANVTITVNPLPPSITSFVASPGTITAGQSATLTGVFVGGTAVITPGNIPATSGIAAPPVSPATTTTYTLTLTPTGGGAPITKTVTITVNPAPAITSFGANPAAITAGQSSTLTGVFANGTGKITPGNLPATSGTGVAVSPAATTIYTLTVTPPAGGTPLTATATVTVSTPNTVTVDLASSGPKVTDQLIGMNMAVWNDTALADAVVPFQAAGVKAVRWPGGSTSDTYHWEGASNDPSSPSVCPSGYAFPNDTFANFVNDLAIPAGLDIALTANYGSNEACNGGGDPSEAAAWVANALTLGVTVSHMTVGNEEYGSWETDQHALKNDAATYAAAVSGASGFYALIKAASPGTLVGVSVNPGNSPTWDPIVLAGAPYDFVEYHYYPETPFQESDTFLVQQAAQGLTADINTIRRELTTAGQPDTPIYVGEIGGPYSNPGKQSWSITQGLYAGQVLGEMMNEGVSRLTWWIGFGNCNGTAGNVSSSVYGWQDFGAYNVFSDGAQDPDCPDAGPLGNMSPTARAFQLFSQVAVTGESVLTATVGGDTTDVRAYAATNNGGTALVLFNDNETVGKQVIVTLTGKVNSTGVTVTTYDKALYDQSKSGTWAAPAATNMGTQTLPLTLTLTPWSMNVVIIK